MAKKISENKIQDLSQDWAKDPSNGLPFSGAAVQQFIKENFNSKLGFLYYDTSSNRYLCFADEASKDKYLENPTLAELVLGAFDAPFNYEASITLLSPSYVPILLGTTGNYVSFDFDIKNKSGASIGESVNATWTFVRGNTKQTLKAKYRYGQTVTLNVDKYLSEGTNNIILSIVGENTLAATSVSITYQVVNLQLSSQYNIAQSYNLQANPSAVAEIPFTVSGYGTKVVEWYLDGSKLPFEQNIDEVTGTSASRTKMIPMANLSQGSHSIQMRAYTVLDGESFYSDTIYQEVIVYTAANTSPIIALSAELPSSMGIASEPLTLEGAVQYIPYVIEFAVYNPLGAAVPVTIAVDGVTQASVTAEGGVVNEFSYVATKEGNKTITFNAENVSRNVGLVVEKSERALEEITESLVLDLQAVSKSNAATDKDQWTYKDIHTTFTGFEWNALSGWNDGALVMGAGNAIDIDFAPLASDATSTGKTLEFEFSTTGVSDDNAVICDLRDSSGTGILITASSASLTSSGGKVLSRSFKSEENIRVGFVINKHIGVVNKGLAFVYINGINSGAVNFTNTDNFMSSKKIHFEGTTQAGVLLRSMRVYNMALTDEQMLNNFTLYRRSVTEMMEVYDRNDIYEQGSENFSMDKIANQLPVMIITGNIPALEETTDKNKSIVVDIEYINYQHPELSFTMKNVQLQPQGTSSMGYPKKNYRIYTQKRDDTKVYDAEGKEITSKLYSFKEGAAPVNCWCMKADYAESSSTHNTSIARLWNDALKNVKVDDEYVCRTEAQKKALENGYPYDVRTTVDGFPIVMAYRLTPTSDLVFIGKYNFNNDKETENVFGFRDIPGFDNSRMQCWEVLNNGHHLALFQDTDNFDVEWKDAFESRYPDTKNPNTADLKAFAQWLTTTTDFATEKWQHLDVYKMAAYYVYVMRFGAVDQMVKNAMFTSEDGQKFYYINYDNDTINGLRNDGYLMYPPTITRQTLDESYTTEVYAYAGHDSVLWNNLEADTEFMQIVQVVDAALYNAGLTYANVIKMFDEEQSAKWCERIYNRDAQYKYVSPFVESGTNNLFMMQGSRQSHRRWWLSKRFSFIDSLFVSGEYKSNVVEAKLANAPIGVPFSITAGIDGNYGYGVNNVAISYGIALEKGQAHQFTTAQVLNIGDPLRIYASPNLSAIDLSGFTEYMSTLNVGGVYTETLGTQLKSLTLGVDSSTDSRRNTALKEISGLNNCKKLEMLNIEGYQGITSVDMSQLNYLKTLKAKASGLTSISLPDGSPIERLELPSAIQGIVFSNVNALTSDNLVFEGGWSNISTISFKRCPNLTNDWGLVRDWFNTKTTENSKCTLVMEGISWTDVEAEKLIALGNIGTLSLKGTIRMSSVDSQQIAAIKAIYGEYVFVKGGELWITAPDGIFITGASEVVEGDSIQLGGDIVSETPGTLTWSIISGEGASITQKGLLSTTELGSARTVTVQIKHVPTIGAVVYNTKEISVLKAIRPTGGTITGDDSFSKTGSYQLSVSPSGINRDYSVNWSVSGEAASGVSITKQDNTSCNLSALSTAAGHLTVVATITTDKGNEVVVTKEVLVGVTLAINILSNQGEDATIDAVIANVSYGDKQFTTFNGDIIGVPAYTLVTITFPDVVGYAKPNTIEYVSSEENEVLEVFYNTTVVKVVMDDNQPSYNDIANAKATISAEGITSTTLSSGGSVKVPMGALCTISWSDVSEYRTPDAITFEAEGASVTKTGTYLTEVVSVTVAIDDLEAGLSVNGAKITIDGSTYTWSGSAIVRKFPFGKTYTITGADVSDDLLAPAPVSYVASQASRNVVMTFITYKPDGIDLSLMDIHGNKQTMHNTANCYVIKETGWYRLPLVYGNAIKNGVPNPEAYTNIDPTSRYTHDFVNYNDVAITSPFIEIDTGAEAVSAELTMADEPNLATNVRIIEGALCKYLAFRVTNIPTTGANMVLSITDENGVVMWSWHIWIWPDDLTPVTITNATSVNYNILPVNLATKKSSTTAGKMYNWFYQWGRPTPMLPPKDYNSDINATNYGVKTFVNVMTEASSYGVGIQNPQTIYGSSYGWFTKNDYIRNLWDANCTSTTVSDNVVVKTVYDPCPVGFKIPNGNTFSGFSNESIIGQFDYGYYLKRNQADVIGVFFPASGNRTGRYNNPSYVGFQNYIWLSVASNDNGYKRAMYLDKHKVAGTGYRQLSYYGYSVRPVQDDTPLNTAYTIIRINQTISDPATMITRTVDDGAIEAIRSHSHRYTGKKNTDGIMMLKQLDDNDGTHYIDGTPAVLTELGTDVWMKLPQFYYKAVEVSTDVWDITFAFGATPSGSGWKEWDGKDMIGVFKGYIEDSMLYSVGFGNESDAESWTSSKSYANNRGDGFCMVKWRHHCMMAFLYCAYYLNTNSQFMIGEGFSSSLIGGTKDRGMIDGDIAAINFWGLENWWGGSRFEYIDDISIDNNSYNNNLVKVLNNDGTERVVGNLSSSGYIGTMTITEEFDLLAKTFDGSGSTGWCDSTATSYVAHKMVRNYLSYSNKQNGGIFMHGMHGDRPSVSNKGARLCYRGDYIIE